MLTEKQRIESQINSISTQLQNFPDGKIFCVKNGKYRKWFVSNGKNQTYIPKKNRKLAEKLAAKKYLLYLLDDLIHEKRAIDFYLRHHSSDVGKAEHLLLNMPEYKELLSPFFKPISQELLDWSTSSYEKNPNFPEQLTHKTLSGHVVRSKSESIIDMLLYINKIPFRYEAPLTLGHSIIYPDFTIRHPQTGKVFYYEHFGMMDDPIYSQKVFSKLQFYTSNGIIPSIHLITTYETKEHPLTTEMVEKIIDYYFR